jgi:hypothetical protein
MELAYTHVLATTLPWTLSLITMAQMWMAGSRHPWTWDLALANQALWLVWICLTGTWGLLPMNAALWVVCIRNRRLWSALH